RLPGPFEVTDAAVLLRGLHARRAAGSVKHVRAVWAAAVLEASLDDVEGPASERQHMGLVLLRVGRLPGKHPALGVEVRPGSARELRFAGAAGGGEAER